MTQTASISNRRMVIEELKKKHTKLFELEGTEKPKFIPKMAYTPKEGTEQIIALFPSEINGGEDVYTEFVNADNVPTDPVRTLYKWPFNPEFETEYQKSEPHPATQHRRYYIPVAELINVAELHQEEEPAPPKEKKGLKTEPIEEKNGQIAMNLEGPSTMGDDAPLSELTIRDQLAIDWKLPVSKKPWLNALITENFK